MGSLRAAGILETEQFNAIAQGYKKSYLTIK